MSGAVDAFSIEYSDKILAEPAADAFSSPWRTHRSQTCA